MADLTFSGSGVPARAPEGRKGRSQAGPKGPQLEVGAQRAPRCYTSSIIYGVNYKLPYMTSLEPVNNSKGLLGLLN